MFRTFQSLGKRDYLKELERIRVRNHDSHILDLVGNASRFITGETIIKRCNLPTATPAPTNPSDRSSQLSVFARGPMKILLALFTWLTLRIRLGEHKSSLELLLHSPST